jgi:hypothetical protein
LKTVEEYIDFYSKLEGKSLDIDTQKRIESYFKNVDFTQFNLEQLYKLGFNDWDEDLILVPMYYYNCIKDDAEFISINNKKVIFKYGETSDDHRFGFLPFGYLKEDVISRHREQNLDSLEKED